MSSFAARSATNTFAHISGQSPSRIRRAVTSFFAFPVYRVHIDAISAFRSSQRIPGAISEFFDQFSTPNCAHCYHADTVRACMLYPPFPRSSNCSLRPRPRTCSRAAWPSDYLAAHLAWLPLSTPSTPLDRSHSANQANNKEYELNYPITGLRSTSTDRYTSITRIGLGVRGRVYHDRCLYLL